MGGYSGAPGKQAGNGNGAAEMAAVPSEMPRGGARVEEARGGGTKQGRDSSESMRGGATRVEGEVSRRGRGSSHGSDEEEAEGTGRGRRC